MRSIQSYRLWGLFFPATRVSLWGSYCRYGFLLEIQLKDFFSFFFFLPPQIRNQWQWRGSSYVSCARPVSGQRTHSQASCLTGLDFRTFDELWQIKEVIVWWLIFLFLVKLALNLTNWTQIHFIITANPVASQFSAASNLGKEIYKGIWHRLAYSSCQSSIPFHKRQKTTSQDWTSSVQLTFLISQLSGNRNCFLLLILCFFLLYHNYKLKEEAVNDRVL